MKERIRTTVGISIAVLSTIMAFDAFTTDEALGATLFAAAGLVVAFWSQIRSAFRRRSRRRAMEELLLLRKLQDAGVLTEVEYVQRATELKAEL